jgi:hypothetical protein
MTFPDMVDGQLGQIGQIGDIDQIDQIDQNSQGWAKAWNAGTLERWNAGRGAANLSRASGLVGLLDPWALWESLACCACGVFQPSAHDAQMGLRRPSLLLLLGCWAAKLRAARPAGSASQLDCDQRDQRE